MLISSHVVSTANGMIYRNNRWNHWVHRGFLSHGTPIAGWFIRENAIRIDDLEVPPWLRKPRVFSVVNPNICLAKKHTCCAGEMMKSHVSRPKAEAKSSGSEGGSAFRVHGREAEGCKLWDPTCASKSWYYMVDGYHIYGVYIYIYIILIWYNLWYSMVNG